VGYAGLQSPQRQSVLLKAMTWVGGSLAFLSILQWYSGNGAIFWLVETRYDYHVLGPFLNRDQYAAFIELLLPAALTRAICGDRIRLACAGVSGIMFASVVVSGSRAGTVLVFLEIVAISALAIVFRLSRGRRVALVAAAVLCCAPVAGWHYIRERFQDADPFAVRRELALSTVQMIRARPAAGFGLGTWPSVYPAFAIIDPPGIRMNRAHNDWLEWAAGGGVAFAAVLLVVAVLSVRSGVRTLWGLGVPVVLVHALVDFPMHKPALACLAFFLLGAAARACGGLQTTKPDKLERLSEN
jgi:hypothetical protein